MTPREMLELAAKAAGYTVNANMQAERDALGYGDAGLWIDGVSTCWNPRNDSKRALELAVQIGLFSTTEQFLEFQAFYSDEIRKDGVPTAATRRAILTIAAMQWVSMQPPKGKE